MQLETLVRRVERAPAGPGVAAFFDYDGTVISGYSAAAFLRHRLRTLDMGPLELARLLATSSRGVNDADAFAGLLEMSLRAWRGRREDELAELGRDLFRDDIASHLH